MPDQNLEAIEGDIIGAESTALAVDLSRAEIDVQIATARKFPRNLTRTQSQLLTYVTLDDETAEECMFALPRGNKPITGPSIRFAESLKAAYGNCRAAARVVHVDRENKVIIAEGIFHDLETNVASRAETRRRISGKNGKLFAEDMIVITGNAACSIALRNAILGGVPKAVWRKAYEAVKRTIAGDVKTLAETRAKAIAALAVYGVSAEMVFAALEVEGEPDIKIDHIPVLRGFFAAIKNEEATVEELFGRHGPVMPAEKAKEGVVVDPLKDDPAPAGEGKPAPAPKKKSEPKKPAEEPKPKSEQTGHPLAGSDQPQEAKVASSAVPQQREAGTPPAATPWTKETYQRFTRTLERSEQPKSLPALVDQFLAASNPPLTLTDESKATREAIYNAHLKRVTNEITIAEMDKHIAEILKGVGG